jgi:hypothetical protein
MTQKDNIEGLSEIPVFGYFRIRTSTDDGFRMSNGFKTSSVLKLNSPLKTKNYFMTFISEKRWRPNCLVYK